MTVYTPDSYPGLLIDKVFCDGIEYEDVSFADDEEGYLEHYIRDENGRFYIGPEDSVASETVYGSIEVTFRDKL